MKRYGIVMLATLFVAIFVIGCGGGSSGGGGGTPSDITIGGQLGYSPTGSLSGHEITATNTTDPTKFYTTTTSSDGTFSIKVIDGYIYDVVAKFNGGGNQQITLGEDISVAGQSINLGTIKVGVATFNILWDGGYVPQVTDEKDERKNFTAWYENSGGRVFYDETADPPCWRISVAILLPPGEPKKVVDITFESSDSRFKGGSRTIEVESGKNTLFLPDFLYYYSFAQILQEFETSGINPFGLTHDGTNFWISDPNPASGKNICKLNSIDMTVIEYYSAGTVVGLAWDGSNIWAVTGTAVLMKYNSEMQIIATYQLPADSFGICWNEAKLYAGNIGDNKVRVYDSSINLTATYDVAGPVSGIAVKNNFFYLSDWSSDKIYKYDSDWNLSSTTTLSFAQPRNIVWVKEFLWGCSTSTRKIYKLSGE